MAVGTASSYILAPDRDTLCPHTKPSYTMSTPRDIDITSILAIQCLQVGGPSGIKSTAPSEDQHTQPWQGIQWEHGGGGAGGQGRLDRGEGGRRGGGGGGGSTTDCQYLLNWWREYLIDKGDTCLVAVAVSGAAGGAAAAAAAAGAALLTVSICSIDEGSAQLIKGVLNWWRECSIDKGSTCLAAAAAAGAAGEATAAAAAAAGILQIISISYIDERSAQLMKGVLNWWIEGWIDKGSPYLGVTVAGAAVAAVGITTWILLDILQTVNDYYIDELSA
jgi:hypothetical protein